MLFSVFLCAFVVQRPVILRVTRRAQIPLNFRRIFPAHQPLCRIIHRRVIERRIAADLVDHPPDFTRIAVLEYRKHLAR